MLGSIVGDILLSAVEGWQLQNENRKIPRLYAQPCEPEWIYILDKFKLERNKFGPTDDTVCTLALAEAYLDQKNIADTLRQRCLPHGKEGFGKYFWQWVNTPDAPPYGGTTNGAVMRLGFIPFLKALNFEEKQQLGIKCTEVTHNSPIAFEAVRQYLLIASILVGNRNTLDGYVKSKDYLRSIVKQQKNVQQWHDDKNFVMDALQTVYQAVACIEESSSVMDAFNNAAYIGGDLDTLGSVVGCFAQAMYGDAQFIEAGLFDTARSHLTFEQMAVLDRLEQKF